MASDSDEPVILASFANEAEAAVVVAALESRGIQVQTTGALTSGFRAEAPGGVQVLVRSVDLERAREVLRERERSGEEKRSADEA
jgi:hypothetical protein